MSAEQFKKDHEYLGKVTKEEFLEKDLVWHYAREVKSGNIIVGDYIKRVVDYQLSRLDDESDPYWFDATAGYKFFAFCRYFYYLSGPVGGTPFILSWWQIWFFSMLLGWKRADGSRQYKIAYLEVARGNGKSTMMSLLGLYMLCKDNEWTPEIYVAATKKEQANILFNAVLAQLEFPKNKKIIEHLKVRRKREYIVCDTIKKGVFKSLSKDSKSFDGMNVHCALIDELHAHPNGDVWNILKSGANKRAQSLMVAITTAGTNLNSFGYSYSKYIQKVITGEAKDDTVFGLIYTIDKDDDPYNPEIWPKANPNWWASINHESFAADIERTKAWPEGKTETFTKLLDIWINDTACFLPVQRVDECFGTIPPENDLYNYEAIVGVDLSECEDMTAAVSVYEVWNDEIGKNHYYVYPKYFIPEAQLGGKRQFYDKWQEERWLDTCGEDIIDYDSVQKYLEDTYENKPVSELAFDRYNATQMAGSLQNQFGEGSVIFVNQSFSGLNEASKFLKVLVYEKRIHFASPIFRWNLLNAEAIESNGLLKVVKSNDKRAKIDGLTACLNALDRFLVRSNYNNEISVIALDN